MSPLRVRVGDHPLARLDRIPAANLRADPASGSDAGGFVDADDVVLPFHQSWASDPEAGAALVALLQNDVERPAGPVLVEKDAAGPGNDDGCVEGPGTPSADGPQIRYYALDVDQHLLNIRSGQTVTWTNASPMAHTATAGAPGMPITAANGGFDSGNLASGGSTFAWTFCAQRTIEWFCATHPAQMYGYQIVVGP